MTGENGTNGRKRRLPEWATEHFKASLDAHEKLMQITRLSQQGMQMHLGRPNAIRVLAEINTKLGDDPPPIDEEAKARLEQAERDAELARSEIDSDFPVLHGQLSIALWSWLEDLVKGLVSSWFVHRPASMNAPAVHRLRVRLGDYLQLTRFEQARFLVDLLEQDLAPPSKQGVARFNGLLEVVGLTVAIEEEKARRLFELHRVRNNLAHRNGRVDAKLRSECPWLRQKVGAELKVGRKMVGNYSDAVGSFLLELLYRVGDVYGIDLRETRTGKQMKKAGQQASTL